MSVAVDDIFKDHFIKRKIVVEITRLENIPEAKIVKKEDFFLPFSIPRFLTFSYHFSLRRSKTKNPEQARSYAHAYKRRRKRRKRRKKKEEEKKKEEKKRKERAACGATSDSPVG